MLFEFTNVKLMTCAGGRAEQLHPGKMPAAYPIAVGIAKPSHPQTVTWQWMSVSTAWMHTDHQCDQHVKLLWLGEIPPDHENAMI